MKTHILIITLLILPLSACGLIGTAVGTGVKAVTTTVDILTENTAQDTQPNPVQQDSALAFTTQ